VVADRVEVVAREQGVGALVVERRPLELEEQQLGLDVGGALLHARHQRAVLGRRRVGREAQGGVVARAAHEVDDDRQLLHRGGQAGRVQLGHLARVLRAEGLGPLRRLVEQAIAALRSLAVHEVLESQATVSSSVVLMAAHDRSRARTGPPGPFRRGCGFARRAVLHRPRGPI
jgi:hypothetical protein